jgi:hypothetical protein
MAGTGPPPAQARITTGLSGDDRGTAVPHDDQAVRGQRLESLPDDAGTDALQGAQLGDRRQLVAGGEAAGLDSLREHLEPVSGIEPLTCRLQDGCSAY